MKKWTSCCHAPLLQSSRRDESKPVSSCCSVSQPVNSLLTSKQAITDRYGQDNDGVLELSFRPSKPDCNFLLWCHLQMIKSSKSGFEYLLGRFNIIVCKCCFSFRLWLGWLSMAHKKYTTFCWEGKKGSVFFFFIKRKKDF